MRLCEAQNGKALRPGKLLSLFASAWSHHSWGRPGAPRITRWAMRRQQRYWTGKAPDWAVQQAGDEARVMHPPSTSLDATPGHTGADPRLSRLGQRQQQSQGGRHAAEAVVLRKHPSLAGGNGEGKVNVDLISQADFGRPEEDDDDEIAMRRMAIRARQATQNNSVQLDEELQGSEDTSSFTSEAEESSDDEHGPAMLKPAFIPKAERKTLEETDGSAMAEQTTKQHSGRHDDRRRQTQELIVQAQLQDVQAAGQGEQSDLDTSDDEESELAQYEAWKQRELKRIARDRHLRLASNTAVPAHSGPLSGVLGSGQPAPKKKWKFLQKYWHKGAFFQSDGGAGEDILGDIMRRDYNAATGEDKFDKQLLPKIMQVRAFGRRGRVKHTHLLAEDTMQLATLEIPNNARPLSQAASFGRPKSTPT